MAPAYKITIIFIFLLVLPGVNLAEEHVKPEDCEIIIDDFSKGIGPGWSEKSFVGETQYSVVQDEGQPYLRALIRARPHLRSAFTFRRRDRSRSSTKNVLSASELKKSLRTIVQIKHTMDPSSGTKSNITRAMSLPPFPPSNYK